MIEEILFGRLKSQVTNVSNRVYPNAAPAGTDRPYLVYKKISPGPVYSHDGYSVSESRYQVSVFADNQGSAKATAIQVKDGFYNWRTSEVQGVLLAGEVDLYNDDTKTHHIPIDFWVWHTRS